MIKFDKKNNIFFGIFGAKKGLEWFKMAFISYFKGQLSAQLVTLWKFLKKIIDINYNETEEDKEREEIL